MTDEPRGLPVLSSTYRADIDGLRAVAVMLVVLYHFDFSAIGGGFIGVDVFFVISGYLISSILKREIDLGSFSFLHFYERRVRRILPALVVVLLASLIAGWFLLLPSDYVSLGNQTMSAAFGLSNFYFLYHSGYFDRSVQLQPLLHTWSLAVEEQFYLAWPLLIYLIHRISKGSARAMITALSAVIALSFGWSVYAVAFYPEAAFYMLPARAWELALGGLIAFLPSMTSTRYQAVAEPVGLSLIVGSALLLKVNTPFPGAAALPACLGAALLIVPKSNAQLISRVLASRPSVALGQISYSLYLWYWPLAVYFRIYNNGDKPNSSQVMVLLAVAVFLSWLSWRYVEAPFRQTKRRVMPVVAMGAAFCTCLAGLIVVNGAGFARRLPGEIVQYDQARQAQVARFEANCAGYFGSDSDRSQMRQCLERKPNTTNVLLVGDSHASHFAKALQLEFPDTNLVSVTSSGCRPVLHFAAKTAKEKNCAAIFETLFNTLTPSQFDVVIISGRWRNGQAEKLPDTVRYLKQFVPHVIVFGQTMEYRGDLPDLLANQYLLRRPLKLASRSNYSRMKAVDVKVRESLSSTAAHHYSVIDAICAKGPDSCMTHTPEGGLFTFDYGHLTLDSARVVLAAFKRAGLTLPPQKMAVHVTRPPR